MGPGLQRHHQHRHLRARARDLRLHLAGSFGGLLRGGVPSRPRAGQAPLRVRGRGVLGGRGHPGRLPARPHRHPRREGGGPDRRVPAAARGVAGQGGRGGAVGGGAGAGHHRRQLSRGRQRRVGRLLRHRRQRPHRGQRLVRAHRRARPRLPRSRGAPRRVRAGTLVRPAPRGALRGGRRAGRRDLRGRPRRDQVGGEGLPLQDRRSRCHREHLHRVGIPRPPQPLRPDGRHRPGQRGHQPRAGDAPVHGLGQHPREGQHRHRVTRHLAGPRAC